MDFYKISVELNGCINRIVDNYIKRSIVCKQAHWEVNISHNVVDVHKKKERPLYGPLWNTSVDRQ